MNRDEVVWYYRLGGSTLGPVAWTEIEELIEDSMEPEDLLVARGGDTEWTSVAATLVAHPELKKSVPPVEATAEPEAEPEAETPWATLDEQPSSAAEQVMAEAANDRHTGARPRVEAAPAAVAPGATAGPGGMPIEHGLGKWIGQAWTMVTGDLATFVLGVLLAGIVTIVTIGICGPPMQAGIVLMALKRFRGEPISSGTVLEGFQYFLPAWGVTLVVIGASIVLNLPLALPAIIIAGAGNGEQVAEALQLVSNTWGQVVGLLIAAVIFYAMVLVVDRNLGSIDAIKGSWAVTSTQLLSYVGMSFVLQLIASAGVLACCVGVLVTAPMVPCAQVAAYMYHFRNR